MTSHRPLHPMFLPRVKNEVKIENENNVENEGKNAQIELDIKVDLNKKNPMKRRIRCVGSDDEEEVFNESNSLLEDKKISNSITPVAALPLSKRAKTTDNLIPSKFNQLLNNNNSSKPIENNLEFLNISSINNHRQQEHRESIPYADLCDLFNEIEKTSKRLEIMSLLRKFFISVFKKGTHEDVLICVYLCINRLCPDYIGLELGIGESLLIKAIAEATGRTLAKIRENLGEVGDLGEVAQNCRSSQPTLSKPKPLTTCSVFRVLKEIASIKGNDSQRFKVDRIKNLLVACKGSEAKFLVRSLEGKLRIGLAEKSVIISLAQASIYNEKKKPSEEDLKAAESMVKSVYSEVPSFDIIVPAIYEYPVMELSNHVKMIPGIPLKPMLAHPTKSISEVLDRFEGKSFTCEYKYDGERTQLHLLETGKCLVFSRNSENLSEKYPDIINVMNTKFNREKIVKSFILDCEAVAWNREKNCILPFQVLSKRKRKDVKEVDIEIQVCVFVFDLLFLNGKSLVRKSLKERRSLMFEYFSEDLGKFQFAKSMESENLEDIQVFLEESILGNCEGLMVKTLDKESTYEPSRRSRKWLKVKKDYLDGAGDSLDLVVLGGYIGKGKRTGVYGGFLLGCYDPELETYQSICKIGTGFSDESLQEHSEYFKNHIIEVPKPYYDIGECKPDVWFDATQVWEVKTADLSISPIYRAAIGIIDNKRGISLRFPRFIKIRDDKTPENATMSKQVAQMYSKQQINSSENNGGSSGDEY